MNNNTSYETQAIDLSLLSVLDITKEGKVVSVEKWVELWTLVFQHINKIDAFCVDMQATLDNWHASEVALNEIIEDMQMKYASLSTGFTHYGEAPPQNPHIKFWVRRMEDIATHCFITNADIDKTYNPESENAQSGTAVAEALSGYVVAEVGKGLSSNDFTNEDKEKLYSALQNENIDKTYNPESPNAQSGIAVAEAVEQVNMALSAAVYKGFVAKENGKGLSTNDFTDEDKEKLGSALQADDISDKMDKFGTVELDGTRLGDVTASVKNFQLLNLTGESGLGLGVHEARLHSKEAAILSKLNTETGDSTEVAVGDGIVNLSSGKDDVILNGVATPTDDNHGTNKQYVDEAVAEAVGVANDYTDKAIKSSKTYANNTFAPAIKNTVSGGVLAVHDVSPVEHDLNIKLSSDTLTDFSNVGVSRLGKNLWTNEERTYSQCFTIVNEDINSITATVTSTEGKTDIPIFEWTHKNYKKWGNKICISFDYEFFNSVSSEFRPNEFMFFTRKNGTWTARSVSKLGGDTTSKQHFSATFAIDTSIDYEFIRFGFYGSVLPTDSFKDYRVELSNIQLEVGSTATDYEPYIEPQTVTANADGTVDGLTSISPNMTIMSDTEGVVIDMTYNADTKMYIDNKLAEISTAIVNNV